jgi:hypothetical protein
MMKSIGNSPIKDDQKIEALDFILENAFRSGFGTLDKSELDAILFAALMKYGDKNSVTDLELSKYLQITQRKIQNLKEKVSVKYLQISREEAIRDFVSKLEYAKKDDIYIDIPIRDVSVKNEIEGILDEKNILLHKQLNSKIFRLRIDDLLELAILFESMESNSQSFFDIRNQIIEKLKERDGNLSEINEKISLSDENQIYSGFKEKLAKASIDVGLELLRALVPGGGLAASIIEKLMKNFGVLQNV